MAAVSKIEKRVREQIEKAKADLEMAKQEAAAALQGVTTAKSKIITLEKLLADDGETEGEAG